LGCVRLGSVMLKMLSCIGVFFRLLWVGLVYVELGCVRLGRVMLKCSVALGWVRLGWVGFGLG